MMKTGFLMFEQKLQNSIDRQLYYLEVIRNGALGLCADYEQIIVGDEDVVWLHEYYHIVNPPAGGSLGNSKLPCSRAATNWSL